METVTMKREIRAVIVVLLASVVVWSLAAQDAAVKIGVVDVEQAILSTTDGKAAREEFQRKEKAAQDELKPLVERFKALQGELEGKKYVLSDEALFEKQTGLLELRNKIENKTKELQGDLKIQQGKLEAPLKAKLVRVVEKVGRDRGFTVILARDTPGVIYTREALDITDDVVSRFNAGG